MPKSYAGSRSSVLHDSEPCILPENGAILYAKTTDIPGVLILVEMPEEVTILHAYPAIISKVLAVVGCQRTGRFCMWILQISQQRLYFLN